MIRILNQIWIQLEHNYCYDNGEKIEHLDYVRDIYEKYFYENSSIKDKLFQVQKNIDFLVFLSSPK